MLGICPIAAKRNTREPAIPTMPFQLIVADYFHLSGYYYLVIGDRLLAWTETLKTKVGSGDSGARGLCNALRENFARFGIPEELASDGGPEFSAHKT